MNFIAEPLSRHQLREYARTIRKQIRCESELRFPVVQFLEAFHELIGDNEFYYECVPDNQLPLNTHAEYDVEGNCVRIKQSVYENAVRGNGRDRMTIIHELSHVLLIKVSGVRFHRTMGNAPAEIYMDPEWQAKCLAGEIMVPAHLVRGMSVQAVANDCGVSQPAAEYQLRSIK